MKIKELYLNAARRFPGEGAPLSVLRASAAQNQPVFDIEYDGEGYYVCRRGTNAPFRVPVHETWCDMPLDPTTAKKAAR